MKTTHEHFRGQGRASKGDHNEQGREAAVKLWDELAGYSASKAEDALRHLMKALCDWIACQDATWVGIARVKGGSETQRAWKTVAVRKLNPDEEDRGHGRGRKDKSAPQLMNMAMGTGKFRVRRLHDGLVDMQEFKKTEPYRLLYEEPGISDRMFVSVPIHQDAESYIFFDRRGAARRFSDEDAELVAFTLRGLKWFFREQMLSNGLLPAEEPVLTLRPMEQRILQLLLTDKSEKEIAEAMGQSPKTTHKYVTEIFSKFRVKGRVGLMSLWLERGT